MFYENGYFIRQISSKIFIVITFIGTVRIMHSYACTLYICVFQHARMSTSLASMKATCTKHNYQTIRIVKTANKCHNNKCNARGKMQTGNERDDHGKPVMHILHMRRSKKK